MPATITHRPTRRSGGSDSGGSGRHQLLGFILLVAGLLLGMFLYAGIGRDSLGAGVIGLVELVIGRAVVLAPLALVAVGGLLVVSRPTLASTRSRIGAGCVVGALLCALAGGLFGLSAGPAADMFAPASLQAGGGIIGALLWSAIAGLIGRGGAYLVVCAGLIGGVMMLAHVNPAGISDWIAVRRDRRTAPSTARGVAAPQAAAAEGVGERAERWAGRVLAYFGLAPLPAVVPVAGVIAPPPGLVVDPDPRVFRGEAVDGEREFPDLYGGEIPDDRQVTGEIPVIAVTEDAPAEAPPAPRPTRKRRKPTQVTTAGGGRFDLPTAPAMLRISGDDGVGQTQEEIDQTAELLEETLQNFGITAEVIGAVSGPRVTRYELRLAAGTKVSKITGLRADLAYALAASDELRILAPIPGKQAVGVEVPNQHSRLVTLGDIWRDFPPDASPLLAWLGIDIGGKPIHADLAKMPHLLIAGSTGTGKSVCLNTILTSLLLRTTPDQLRMVLIDPKKVELNHFERLPHLLTPVVTNMKMATAVLANLVREMESRYELMGMAKARNIGDWNRGRLERGEPPVPMLLVVIDELADLMMVAPGEVEDAIIRLAQKARAVGIHLILATQRPSVDVITGLIKANVPSRIAFAVSSQIDSRVILDTPGAESLLGGGDMLFRPVGTSRQQRIQGAYVSEEEVLAVCEHWRRQAGPELREEMLERPEGEEQVDLASDELIAPAIELVVDGGQASVSLLQRRLGVGYARAGRLIDTLERMGVVSGQDGSKPRTVLVGEGDLPRLLGYEEEAAEMDALAAPAEADVPPGTDDEDLDFSS